jgi:glutamyl-tRNA reductase
VALHDLSGLDAVLRDSLERRRLEVPRVEAVVEHELRWLHVWSHEQMIRPLLNEMRARIETIRVAELEHAQKAGLQDVEAVDRLTRRMVDKMLAIPASLLKRDVPLDTEHLHVLRALFMDHLSGQAPHGANGHAAPGGNGHGH